MTWKAPTELECQNYLRAKANLQSDSENVKLKNLWFICYRIFDTPLRKPLDLGLLNELAIFLEFDQDWGDTVTKKKWHCHRSLACAVMDAWVFYCHSKALSSDNNEQAELYLIAFKKSFNLPGFWEALESLEHTYHKNTPDKLPKLPYSPSAKSDFDFDLNTERAKELGLERISKKDLDHARNINRLMGRLSFNDDKEKVPEIIKSNLKTIVQATLDGDSRFFREMVQCIDYTHPEEEWEVYLSILEFLQLPVTSHTDKKKDTLLKSKPLWSRRHWVSRLLWMMDRNILRFEPVGLSNPQISNLYNRDRLKTVTPPYISELFDLSQTSPDKVFRIAKNCPRDLVMPTWNYLTLDLS